MGLFCLTGCILCGHLSFAQMTYEGRRDGFTSKGMKDRLNYEEHEAYLGMFTPTDTKKGLSFLSNKQKPASLINLTPPDTFMHARFWLATGLMAGLYAGTTIALNAAWYQQYPRSSFHFFDDSREWRGMDKMGHLYTAYFESQWAYHIAGWTGMREHTSVWTGAALGLFFQSTVEVLDGFSSEWGFSWADAGCNVLGAGMFVGQQQLWGEQRIRFKVSSTPIHYSDAMITSQSGTGSTTLRTRAEELFGSGYAERFLKDYNAQTTWLSANISAFLHPDNKFPKWLNIAVGYGAENMYGGFANRWNDDAGASYVLPVSEFPRYSQFYLSPDIDFTRIPSRSPLVRTLLGILNIFKIPGPVLEVNSQDGVQVKLRW